MVREKHPYSQQSTHAPGKVLIVEYLRHLWPPSPLATRKPQPPFPHGTCLEHPQPTEVLKVFVMFFSLKWAQKKSSNVNKAKKFCTARTTRVPAQVIKVKTPCHRKSTHSPAKVLIRIEFHSSNKIPSFFQNSMELTYFGVSWCIYIYIYVYI